MELGTSSGREHAVQKFLEQSDWRGRRSVTAPEVTYFIQRMRAVRESEERLTRWMETTERDSDSLARYPTRTDADPHSTSRLDLENSTRWLLGSYDVSALLWLGTSSPEGGHGKSADAQA